jgi:hypothetical protein
MKHPSRHVFAGGAYFAAARLPSFRSWQKSRRAFVSARRAFKLHAVLVIVSLVFWFWMWGVPGAILSVPILAITKIICDRVRPLTAFGHLFEG